MATCCFIPRLKTQTANCGEPVHITYGTEAFCKKHHTSAQALRARDLATKAKASEELEKAKEETKKAKKVAEDLEERVNEAEKKKVSVDAKKNTRLLQRRLLPKKETSQKSQ